MKRSELKAQRTQLATIEAAQMTEDKLVAAIFPPNWTWNSLREKCYNGYVPTLREQNGWSETVCLHNAIINRLRSMLSTCGWKVFPEQI